MAYRMTVMTPNEAVFNAYWYGNGRIIMQGSLDGQLVTVVDYGDDDFRAEYQAGRFASGLYFAKVEEV